MSPADARALNAALILCAILLGLFLLSACASAEAMHSWGDGRSPWIDYSGECADSCTT